MRMKSAPMLFVCLSFLMIGSAAANPFAEIDAWKNCVHQNVQKFAVKTNEPADMLLNGAYSICKGEEFAYFAYLQKTASDGPSLNFSEISAHLRSTFEGDFVATILLSRSGN